MSEFAPSNSSVRVENRSRPRRALITGGAGFIGSHLAESIIASGGSIVAIDDLSTGNRRNAAHLPADRFHLIEATVAEGLAALGDDERFDEIYHLAAGVGVDLVLERPTEVIEGSLRNASAVLDAARRWHCPVLLASSSEVYGKSERVPFREEDDVVYGPTTMTRWSYAYAKGMDEFVALNHHQRHETRAVIARFFNTVGPRQSGEWGMVLPRFVSAALRGEPLRVFGDGRQQRCFCDVRDVARILPVLLRRPESAGGVFNVGGDRLVSVRELAQRVCTVVGSVSRIELVPYERAYAPGFEDVAVRQPDLTRLRTATGFEPTISLDQTIRDLASWMREAGAAGQTGGPVARAAGGGN